MTIDFYYLLVDLEREHIALFNSSLLFNRHSAWLNDCIKF